MCYPPPPPGLGLIGCWRHHAATSVCTERPLAGSASRPRRPPAREGRCSNATSTTQVSQPQARLEYPAHR
eukprot:6200417-Pleurochrysis_carterae.AAC.4